MSLKWPRRHGGKRNGAGRPNPWGEPLRKVTIRIPERLYDALDRYAEAHGYGLSHTIVSILKKFQPQVKTKEIQNGNGTGTE